MANLTPTAGWDSVLQLETSTRAVGGVGGSMNLQAQALLNRIEQLKLDVEALGTGATRNGTTEITVAPSGGSAGVLSIDYELGDYFDVSYSSNITSIQFTNLPAAGIGITFVLALTKSSGGVLTATWPATFGWPASTPGVLTGSDMLALTSFNAGASWYATLGTGFTW